MKFLLVLGSPRKRGNTAKLLRMVEEALEARGVETEFVFLDALEMHGCRACEACRNQDGVICKIDDDLLPVLEKLVQADGLVLASPVYMWSMTAQAKMFLDRTYGILDQLRGKRVLLVGTAGGDENDGLDLMIESVKRQCRYAKMDYRGCFFRAPADRAAMEDEAGLRKQAEAFAGELLKL
ncbi:MAG: flavodoxin family protein [Anaerolineaceae bacterium]|nr:flavodoxin family protein [Anaerolineaceae bacterium]